MITAYFRTNKENVIAVSAVFLVSLWPYLNFINVNKDLTFNMWLPFFYSGISVAIVLAVTFLAAVLLRAPFSRIAVASVAFVICFYSFALIVNLPFFGEGSLYGPFVLWLLITIAACFIMWRLSKNPQVAPAVLVATLVMSVVPLSGYFVSLLTAPKSAAAPTVELSDLTPFLEKPNVYTFLIDSYARNDVLKNVFEIDNTGFADSLRERGFSFSEKSTVNYPYTLASVSSLLSMNYFRRDEQGVLLGADARKFGPLLLGYNPVVDAFKSQGYSYVLAPTGVWASIDCGGADDLCIKKNNNRELERNLIELTPLRLKFASNLHGFKNFQEPKDLSNRLDRLPAPFFFFAHIGGVHDSIYQEDCTEGYPSSPRIYDQASARRFGVSTLCMNDQMLSLIDEIIENDPTAVILLLSDHGPHVGLNRADGGKGNPSLWQINTTEEFRNKFGNLNAMRLPDDCPINVPADISSVNVFRVVIGCLQGVEPDLLPNQSYHVTVPEGEEQNYNTYSAPLSLYTDEK